MDPKILWLIVFVGLYWSYCLYMGFKGMATAKTASDYFIGGRKLSLWVFVLAGTATSFSGWTFVGHPGLLYVDGFQYAYASFYAITIPFTGVMFLKRQWMLGKRFGYVTPGEMMSDYFRSDLIRLLVVLVALIFSIPYTGIQFRASGFLFNVLTDGALSIEAGMWMLSMVVLVYVATGGLRSVAYVDSAQAILLALGIVIIGCIALINVGGWSALNDGIATLAQYDGKRTPDGHSHYVAIPGVIQFVSEGPSATGGAWTGIMILTYMFALMGIQSAPAFSMWAYSNTDPRPFPIQQVWASALGIGLILMVFTAIQGLGAHLLGANAGFLAAHPEAVTNVFGPLLDGQDLMDYEGKQGALVPQYINLMGETLPWLMGLLAVCALAAMQSTGAAYMSTAGGMLTRDILKRYLIPNASHNVQKLWGRLGVAFIVFAALWVATSATDALVLLGGLAVAYGFQMWPALIATCWWPWLTRQGVNAGLIAGLVAVTLTERVGVQWFGIEAWGRWPLTIHAAGWGIIFNLGLAILVSAFTQNPEDRARRMVFHDFLREHAGLPAAKKPLVPVAWIVTLAWFFFAIGPGAVIGNTIFGDPGDPATWVFGMPSIWAWQILWWVLGVGMMWFLAIHMRMSTMPEREIEVLQEDIGDVAGDTASGTVGGR
ncbi:Na+/solute symporter [Salinisphaera sp. PC39]|uniref:sodium:solute symporter family protein n=1 Tax=Salinisphaera sp. PC39 TaxID=1304156 RepID=UPI0033428E30